MNKVVRRILSIIPAVLLQGFWIFVLIRWLSPYAALCNLFLSLCAILFVLYLMTSLEDGAYKTLWLLVILGMPIAGTVLYLFFGNKKTGRPLVKKLKRAEKVLSLPDSFTVYQALQEQDPRMAQTFRYIQDITGFSLHRNQTAAYYPLGEKMFEAMKEALEKAERFIFAEYFIIENGFMWDSLVEILERKVHEGVDVRVMYDDLGSISTYAKENVKALQKKGIRCIAFNPMVFIRGTLNYRDHRKMLVIDGKIAFSGGVNLADEYINKVQKFGHWKDIGFQLTGPAVQNYTQMFVQFWNAFSKDPIPESLWAMQTETEQPDEKNGYVLSYYDSPLRSEAASNELYIELLSQAEEYAWFYTPYLMLGEALLSSFVRAARRGVDVRIIMPGIPDKKLVFRMSRSYYSELLKAGVKIYEYLPGFVHAKACLVDDKIGTIGTVNLDYRSLFLHFENNSLFYQAPLLQDLKADFQGTQEQCEEKKLGNSGLCTWIVDGILRILAPLC